MSKGIPEVGEVVWHDGKAYSTCEYCYKLVQLNKPGFGSVHLCLTAYERALKDHSVASKETVADLLREWDSLESLLFAFAKEAGIRGLGKPKISKAIKGLHKKQYLDDKAVDLIEQFSNLMADLGKKYKKGYDFGDWITPKTSEDLYSSISMLKDIFSKDLRLK